jgi:hypothetical protein
MNSKELRHLLATATAALLVMPIHTSVVGSQGPGGFGPMGGVRPERELVAQFDRNGDKRLDATERRAARDWLATQGADAGFGGPGGRRGGPPGGGGRGPGGRGGLVAGTPGPRIKVADVKPVPASVSLYDPTAMRTFFLEFENADWEQELEAFKDTDVEVPATVTVDGKRYANVGVHFRGASSYMMIPTGSKRSLNLSFDFVDDNQQLLGYRTINLLNANSDPTFVRTVLFSHIANQYIPAPRANLSRVVINGELWGVYVNVQQFNKDFLRDFYKTTDGARWKVPGSPGGRGGLEYLGDDIAAYKRLYEIKSKDDPKRWADLANLTRVLNTTPAAQLEKALAPILDVHGALRFLAVDAALANSDGYWARASDYNIYQDGGGRFHILPHDMNEALLSEGGGRGGPGGRGARGPGGFPGMPGDSMRPLPPPDMAGRGGPPMGGGRGGGGPTLDPLVGLDDATKPLRSKLLAVPALRERYLGYVRDIAQRWLDWKTIDPLVTRWQSVVAADVAADTRKLYSTEAFTTGLRGAENSLERFMTDRRTFLLERTRER